MINTIGDLIDGGYRLTIWCRDIRCFHNAEADLDTLAARFDRDHGAMHADLAHRFRCSKCGGRNIGLQIQPKKLPGP